MHIFSLNFRKFPDDTEVVKSLTRMKSLKKSGLNEKMALLERAEENYYQNKISVKQVWFHRFFFPPDSFFFSGKQKRLFIKLMK